MNIFLSTRRLTNSKENHLTEFLDAALHSDRAFREAYASVVLRGYAVRQGWADPEIAEVATQMSYKGAGCCPDLVLTLRDGHVIACEHKIDAPETVGETATDGGAVLQLERYLQLPVHGVAYFRSSWSPPVTNVLEDPRYVKPSTREHFLWSDLYPALQAATTDLARWVKEGFDFLGYTPPHPAVGDLTDPDPATRTQNRKNFAKLWQSTRSTLREMGWKVGAGSISELYVRSNPDSAAELVYVSPHKDGGRVLLLRVTPRNAGIIQAIEQRFGEAAEAMGLSVEVASSSVPRAEGPRAVVDVAVSLTNLLHGSSTAEQLERKLWSYVVPLVRAIDQQA